MRITLLALLIAAMAYFVFIVPRMEGEQTLVPRASQKWAPVLGLDDGEQRVDVSRISLRHGFSSR